ncbi:hypothetical protein BGW36DRAFT_287325, partial [Talaromyces proteolyticus]
KHVLRIVEQLVESDQRVIMLMHSYGGAVGTDAVEGLSLSVRQSQKSGQSVGGVIHLTCVHIS